MSAKLYSLDIEVRWRDLDAFNHVNNASYLGYVEEARVRWFKSFAMCERLAVMQRFRGHNVGQLLLERCRKLAESRGCNSAGASSAQWHSSESAPETRPNRPIAAVGKGSTRRVSSE